MVEGKVGRMIGVKFVLWDRHTHVRTVAAGSGSGGGDGGGDGGGAAAAAGAKHARGQGAKNAKHACATGLARSLPRGLNAVQYTCCYSSASTSKGLLYGQHILPQISIIIKLNR